MDVKLHANATTTPKTRAYIQSSRAPVAVLARELGVNEKTIRRWRGRTEVTDRSHRPRRLMIGLSALEEALVCDLRRELDLPLDDIVEVMRRCVRPSVSRSGVHRCLQRHGISRRAPPGKPQVGRFETAPVGFIHIDVKHLPALDRRRSYAFVAIDRASRYVYLEIHPERTSQIAAAFLERLCRHFPCPIHTLLTDNGAEFTDRFGGARWTPAGHPPSGNHPLDQVCRRHGITHRLTRPFHPQTNGMVERFNRRLAEALRAAKPNGRNAGKNRFNTHNERDAFLNRFVDTYNQTRLKCLNYNAPRNALANLTGPYTKAGISVWGRAAPVAWAVLKQRFLLSQE